MTAARAIIDRAAEIIGYKDPDESLSGTEAANFLGVLNSMVDAWSRDNQFVYAITETVQTVSGNPITVGSGGTIDIDRPENIPSGGFFRVGGIDYPFEMLGREQYEAFRVKSITTAFPRYCYYETSLPLANLYFYPALVSAEELHLPTQQQVAQFANLDTDYNLAKGYKVALEYSLAEELAPGRRPLDPNVLRLAMRYRAAIQSFDPPMLSTDWDRKQGNILTGWTW